MLGLDFGAEWNKRRSWQPSFYRIKISIMVLLIKATFYEPLLPEIHNFVRELLILD
jgi:hypothetical protein